MANGPLGDEAGPSTYDPGEGRRHLHMVPYVTASLPGPPPHLDCRLDYEHQGEGGVEVRQRGLEARCGALVGQRLAGVGRGGGYGRGRVGSGEGTRPSQHLPEPARPRCMNSMMSTLVVVDQKNPNLVAPFPEDKVQPFLNQQLLILVYALLKRHPCDQVQRG